jgi:dipeptidyl aminopeptidase/acylaminoacyl peptidase
MGAPRLSPDGQQVLVQISDSTADGGKSHLWLIDIEHNTFRQLTFTPAKEKSGEGSGTWMPDGSAIVFLAHRGDHTQLYKLPMQGGEAVVYDLKAAPAPITAEGAPTVPPPPATTAPATPKKTPDLQEIDVSSYKIAPDGKTIAILAKDPVSPEEKKNRDAKADASWVDHDQHATRLYLLDVATGKLTPTATTPDVQSVAWSPASDRLLAIAEKPNGASDLGPARSSWMLTIADPQHPVSIPQIPPTVDSTAWSGNAKWIVFLAQAAQDTPPGYTDLYRYDVAQHSVQNLTGSFHGSGFSGSGFQGSIGYAGPIAADNADTILQSVALGVRVTVARFNLNKNRMQLLHFDAPVVDSLTTNPRHTGWVYLANSSTQPTALRYAKTLDALDTAKTLAVPTLIPSNWTRVPSQAVHWKNNGFDLEGLLYLPPQAAHGKVPLIVSVHGGPLGAWEDSYDAWIDFIVGHGWAVFLPNPRGSSGYGASFAAANKNDLGGGDYRDIMTGVDAVLQQFPLDSNHMALFGYSYGGEMAGFVEGKTTRFKAIICGAPVIDQYSEYGTESDSWYDRWYFGKPWETVADAWRQSPLSGAAHAKTPFLLLQGEADTTDPLGQSQEMYRALRQEGVPVEMVQYPREDHGPLAEGIFGAPSSEPWHGYDARERIVQFLSKALGTGDITKPATGSAAGNLAAHNH